MAAPVTQNDNLAVIIDQLVPKNLRRFYPVSSIMRGIRQGGSEPSMAVSTKTLDGIGAMRYSPRKSVGVSKVIKEDKAFGMCFAGVVVSLTAPAVARCASLGQGLIRRLCELR